jgi:hypothetical protein
MALARTWPSGLLTAMTATDGVFRIGAAATTETTRLPCTSFAAELKLHSCGTEIRNHPPERITQAFGRLGPAYRAAHRVAHHRIKPRMKFCYRSGEALAGQFGQRHVEGGEASSARSRASALLVRQAAIASPGCMPRVSSHALTQGAKSASRSAISRPIEPAERTNSEIIVSIVSVVSERESNGHNERNTVAVHDETAGL